MMGLRIVSIIVPVLQGVLIEVTYGILQYQRSTV